MKIIVQCLLPNISRISTWISAPKSSRSPGKTRYYMFKICLIRRNNLFMGVYRNNTSISYLLLLFFLSLSFKNIFWTVTWIFFLFSLFCYDSFGCRCSLFTQVKRLIKALTGPKYDGEYLHGLVKELLGNRRLHHTLTKVVIPTFDIKTFQPTIFSSFEVRFASLLLKLGNFPTV
jgi:hypothetical protein